MLQTTTTNNKHINVAKKHNIEIHNEEVREIMNKIYFFFIMFLFPCQNSKLDYSCDPVINEFVAKKTAELSQLTVKELTSYEINLQRAIFNSWDYRRKRNARIEKLTIVLEHKSFSRSEKDHIQKVIDHLDYDYFPSENIIAEVDYRFQFADQCKETNIYLLKSINKT